LLRFARNDRHAASAEGRRALCNALCLWHLCPRAACRRRQVCRGRDPDACVEERSPLVPEAAVRRLFDLGALRRQGFSYDEAAQQLAPEGEPLGAWILACREARGKARRSP
jgi:hypothetical protein